MNDLGNHINLGAERKLYHLSVRDAANARLIEIINSEDGRLITDDMAEPPQLRPRDFISMIGFALLLSVPFWCLIFLALVFGSGY